MRVLRPLISVAGIFVIALATAPLLCGQAAAPSGGKRLPAVSPTNQPASVVAGKWFIDVDATAESLARGEFASRQQITFKSGATRPETNLVTKPFNQKEYKENKKFWVKGLKEPEMQWQLVLRPDGTGEHIARVEGSKEPKSNPVKWALNGSELRLDYPEEKKFNRFTARLVSGNELHYPMQPLGGWMVLRKK